MNNEEKLAELEPIVVRVAKRIASEHHVIEADDVAQELRLFIIQRGESIPAQSEVSWSLQSFLTRVARMYAFRQKQQHYIIDPNVCYEVKDVRVILSTHFNRDHWTAVQDGESVEEAIASHSDVAWALHRLSKDDKDFVARCYTEGPLPASGSKDYRKLRDLIIKIANMLNHWTRADEGNGPGRRKAISNSQASAVLDVNNAFSTSSSSNNYGRN